MLQIEVDEHALAAALTAAGVLHEMEALERANLAAGAGQVLETWARSWK